MALIYSKDDVKVILEHLGYSVDKNYKFKLRQEENTASASINPKDGRIKDFGSGEYYSIIDIMTKFHGFTNYRQSKYYIEKNLNIAPVEETDFSRAGSFKKFEPRPINSPVKKEQQTPRIITENSIDYYKKQSVDYYNNYNKLLKELLPTVDDLKRLEVAKKYEIGYSSNIDRLIMPIRNEQGQIITLWKYNKNQNPKVLFEKNCPRIPFNFSEIEKYKTENRTIFILEGEKDTLNAVANNIAAITFGQAIAHIDLDDLNKLKNTNVLIAFDLDETGKKGALKMKEQLKNICSSVDILDIKELSKEYKLNSSFSKGFDFTDFLQLKNNKIIDKGRGI